MLGIFAHKKPTFWRKNGVFQKLSDLRGESDLLECWAYLLTKKPTFAKNGQIFSGAENFIFVKINGKI